MLKLIKPLKGSTNFDRKYETQIIFLIQEISQNSLLLTGFQIFGYQTVLPPATDWMHHRSQFSLILSVLLILLRLP